MAVHPPPVSAEFFLGNTVEIAKELIGMHLVRIIDETTVTCRIVETEAYREDDPASHSYSGPTDRCRIMFDQGGVLYVYRSYGVHYCINVVTEAKGIGCAVLIRGVEPLGEKSFLWGRRFPDEPLLTDRDTPSNRPRRSMSDLTNGPGKLSVALGITSVMNGHRLDREPFVLSSRSEGDKPRVSSSRRIGISRAKERRWRFYETGNRFVSRSRNVT